MARAADHENGQLRRDAPAVCLQDVSFAYEHTRVLERVNFDVFSGDFACIVGPNGGGKSTLLRLIVGELTPASGTVRVFGRTPAAARHQIGYTPQHLHFDPLFPVSVLDVVLMGRLDHHRFGRYRRADHEAARAALEQVQLADLAQRHFGSLSGGQRQRTLIARALVCRPDLLALDEPTANVDAAVGQRLLELLAELNREMTILMVSHDLRFVSGAVNRVLCVDRQVVAHPTSDVTSTVIRDLYGADVRLVRHDHRDTPPEHDHD